MNRSIHSFGNMPIARRLLLLAVVLGANGSIMPPSVVSAQQRNPFVTPPSYTTEITAELSVKPTARAHLQMPRENGAERDWRTLRASVRPQTAGAEAPPNESRSSVTPPNRVGPRWSSFTPGAFAQAMPRTPVAAASVPGSVATRPSRLPATGGDGFVKKHDSLPAPVPGTMPNSPRTRTRLASAAPQRSEILAQTPSAAPSAAPLYLTSQTAQSQIDAASELFQQASLEYQCGAFASAETSAWDALEKAAQAIDLAATSSDGRAPGAPRRRSAAERLHLGRRAIVEAQDFVGPFAQDNRRAIARLARSHETPVVRETLPPMRASYSAEARARLGRSLQSSHRPDDFPTVSEAIDRYLDFARTNFSGIASESLLAAQTMDLLAAIRMGRAEPEQLPGPTAVCLRRAAVQGQSNNPDLVAKLGHQLADIGLVDEARWALGHSLKLQHNPVHAARLARLQNVPRQAPASQYGSSILAATRPRPRANQEPKHAPEVTNISPQQFAAISHSVIPGSPNSQPAHHQAPRRDSAKGPFQNAVAKTPSPSAPTSQSFFQAVTASFKTPANDPVADSGKEKRVSSQFFPGMKKWWGVE